MQGFPVFEIKVASPNPKTTVLAFVTLIESSK
jgi:hypothetical protein